jgi:protein disulfide-isomerase A6
LLACAVFDVVAAKSFFSDKTEVVSLSKLNFNNVIKKNRDDHVSLVMFYANHDGNSKKAGPEYEKLALDLKGIVRLGAVDCADHADVCKEYDIETHPSVKLFPTGSYKFVQDWKGEMNMDKIKKWATKALPNFVTKIDTSSVDEWLGKNKSKPHAILFTDKPKTASLTKALSADFKGRILMGEAQASDSNLVKRFKVKKFPALVIQLNEKDLVPYKGEMTHTEIFKVMNNYAETNAMEKMHAPSGGDDEPARPWLNQPVPQVIHDSLKDVCLDIKGVCMIAFANGEAGKLNAGSMDILLNLKNKFEANIDRGTKFAFMWVDATVESEFTSGFGIESKPAIIAFKPGKRKRFALHEGDFSEKSISEFCDKVMGGDVRFKNMPELPKLTPPPPKEDKKKK